MIKSYWRLFTIPGAAWFSLAAFLGRLPAGMIALAIIMPISKFTNSYMMAGMVAAFTMAGMALFAPFSGRLVDRHGQRQVLFSFATLNFVGTSVLIICAQYGTSLAVLCVAGALTGASRLSTGMIARIRWIYVTQELDTVQRKSALQAAYAFESIVDEVVFICAPILVTFLCTIVHPLAGLVSCLLSYVIGAVALAIQSKTQPPIEPIQEKQSPAFYIPELQIIFAATLFIGISAGGAVEVIVVAHMDDAALRPLVGLLMATLSFGSLLAGFWYGARTFKPSAQLLWVRCIGLLVIALIPLAFANTLITLALALFIAGLLIAPTSIAGQVLTKQILPASKLSEGMSIIVTAMILGMAGGSWLAGFLIDKLGVQYANGLPATAALSAFVVVAASRTRYDGA